MSFQTTSNSAQRNSSVFGKLSVLDRFLPILILDEATANLDAITERAVMETILRVTAGRSLLILPTAIFYWIKWIKFASSINNSFHLTHPQPTLLKIRAFHSS